MFGALRVETYRGSRSIEQAQVLAIPPEGYDSPSRATPSPLDPYNVLSGFSDSSTVPIYNFCWRKALWEMRVSCTGTQHSNHAKDRTQNFNPLATVSHTTESNELTLFFPV